MAKTEFSLQSAGGRADTASGSGELGPMRLLQRRELFLLPAAIALVGSPGIAEGMPTRQVALRSPKDGFIEDVIATDANRIEAGDLVLRINPSEETRELSRLESVGKALVLVEDMLTDESLKSERRMAEAAVRQATDSAKVAAEFRKRCYERYVAGLCPKDPYSVNRPEENLLELDLEMKRTAEILELAQLAQSNLEQRIVRARNALAIAKQQLAVEIDATTFKRNGLELKAPIPGSLELLCVKGQFVTQGMEVARING